VNVCEVTEDVQDSVAVPEGEVVVSVMLVGLIVHVRPVEGDGLAVRLIVPAKPLGLETVIVDDPGVPEKTTRPVGLALKVKSCTVYVTLVAWLREDPEPVTVTVYVPIVPAHERVEIPLVTDPSEMLVGDRVQVRPVEGETTGVSETVPVNPLKPATVIVEVPAVPEVTPTLAGLTTMVKS
jgi:hypothetical protein